MEPLTNVLGPSGSAQAGGASGTTAATNDFDTFLTLLTAQIRNQDPLEPADSTEYTAQLATFSNVEQSIRTNTLLEQMVTRLDTQQVTAASDYIGMEVRHSGPVSYDGSPIELVPQINPTADRAELVVTDDTGTEIARSPVDPDAETLVWPAPGLDGDFEDGNYLLHVESWAGELELSQTTVAHYATVEEVVLAAGGAQLMLEGGVRLPIDWLESIRSPQAAE